MEWTSKVFLIVTTSALMGCAKDSPKSESIPPPYSGRPLKVTDFPNVEKTALGAWTADNAEFGNGLYYVLNIYLNNRGDVGFGRTCGGHGEVISASTVVNGTVTDNQIDVAESAQITARSKKILDCTLAVQAGALNYQLSPNAKLLVEITPGGTQSFSRIETRR